MRASKSSSQRRIFRFHSVGTISRTGFPKFGTRFQPPLYELQKQGATVISDSSVGHRLKFPLGRAACDEGTSNQQASGPSIVFRFESAPTARRALSRRLAGQF